MDWQFVAMWLVVGGVVIWIAAKAVRKYLFKESGGKKGDPPCCG